MVKLTLLMKNKISQGFGGKVTMNSDELFTKIANLGGLCIDGLTTGRFSLPSIKEIYSVGEYEAMLVPSLVGKNKPYLEFWKRGYKKKKFVRVTDRFFIIFSENERVILSDFAGEISINKHMGEYPSFPLFEFSWTGKSSKKVPVGTLKFARVDLKGSDFVSYHYDGTLGKYTLYNPQKREDLLDLGVPVNLEEADEIMEIPFKKLINFNEALEKIRKSLEFEEFHRALLNCT